MKQNAKIALAHDWFTQYGGAERVMGALHELFPESPIFTLVKDNKLYAEVFGTWDIRPSFLQYMYGLVPRLQYLLVFIPLAARLMRIKGYDVLLSSSSSFMKAVRVSKSTLHINYCHTPTRFLWTEPQYMGQEVPWFLRPLARLYVYGFRRWDLAAASRVDYFIANSKEVQKRIRQFYKRTSEVIHPFVDTIFWQPTREKQDYFLVAGRLHAHKGNELIVEIFNELGWPLHVVGTGRQEQYLRAIAKPNITFLGRVDDAALRDEYSGALGFVYPQLEDFGLMPLEAAACGTATLGFGRGGSLETIIPGQTGELFAQHNKAHIISYLKNWEVGRYSTTTLRSHAQQFSKEKFKEKMADFVTRVMNSSTSSHEVPTIFNSTNSNSL